MRLHRILLILAAAFLASVAGCSDSDSPMSPIKVSGRMEDFVVMPVGQMRQLRHYPAGPFSTSEPYIWWDIMIGEPFTDMNGNGFYDFGFDLFVRSADPSLNQDLNHNGTYDGPTAYGMFGHWEPGIPFDDVNQDGLYTYPESTERHFYIGHSPYADLNGNGIFDAELDYASSIVEVTQTDWRLTYAWRNEPLYFVSDSGFVVHALNPSGYWPTIPYHFYFNGPSLWCGSNFCLLDTGAIVPQQNVRRYHDAGFWSFYRSVEFLSSYSFGGVNYSDLLHISCHRDSVGLQDGNAEFYFVRNQGLVVQQTVIYDQYRHQMDTVSYQLLLFDSSLVCMRR